MVENKGGHSEPSESNFSVLSLASEGQKQEVLRSSERYELTEAVAVVFYHKPGVGGSTLSRRFGKEALGLSDDRIYDSGGDLRSRAGRTPGETEHIQREDSVDEDLDQKQILLMLGATLENPIVINAKLGGFNVWKLRQEHPEIKVISVLVTCDADTAAKRKREQRQDELKAKRDSYEDEFRQGEITEAQYDLLLDALDQEEERNTIKNKKRQTKERVRDDMETFRSIYPELEGIDDIWAPQPTLIVGHRVNPKTDEKELVRLRLFDYQISTTHKNQDASKRSLIQTLLNDGQLKKVEDEKPKEDKKGKKRKRVVLIDNQNNPKQNMRRNSNRRSDPSTTIISARA